MSRVAYDVHFDRILGVQLGHVGVKVKKINNIISAWPYRDLNCKGKALTINGPPTSILWYNVTAVLVHSRAITSIERVIYDVFCIYKKRHFVNKEILALPFGNGGFNFSRLQTKNWCLSTYTLIEFLSNEDAHWEHFLVHFLRISICS